MSLKKEDSKIIKSKDKKAEQDRRSASEQSSINKSNVSSRENKLRPILLSSVPGDAIMGYVKEELPPKKLPPLKENNNKALNSDLESKVESVLVSMLEARCTELGRECEEAKAKRKEIEVENCLLKSTILNLEKDFREVQEDLLEEQKSRLQLSDELELLKESLNRSKRELGRTHQDLSFYQDIKSSTNVEIENLKSQNQADKQLYEQEIKMLKMKIEELEEENEDFRSKLEIKSEIDARVEEQRNHYIKEIQLKSVNEAEAKLERITKLLSENAKLDEKLKESENLRRKYQEKNAANEEKIKYLTESLRQNQELASSLKKQLTDLKSMKTHTMKIYEDKIQSLVTENEKIKKDIESFKKNQHTFNNTSKSESEDSVILQKVEAKPYLFGPVDSGKF